MEQKQAMFPQIFNDDKHIISFFNIYANTFAIVTPILTPVKDPGPLTTMILSISLISKSILLKPSLINGIILEDISSFIIPLYLYNILLLSTIAIDTKKEEVSKNNIFTIPPHIILHIFVRVGQ